MMEDIKNKAFDDELNKSEELIEERDGEEEIEKDDKE